MKDHIAIILNSLLYILNKFEGRKVDTHKLFKTLYFAEQRHLKLYGKSITDDDYAAMKFGPVPSIALDIINCHRGRVENDSLREAAQAISVEGYFITSLQEVDLDWLSKSELKCLDEAFEENKNLSFNELTEKSHDSAWQNAYHYMDKVEIAKAAGVSEEMAEYITSKKELQDLVF